MRCSVVNLQMDSSLLNKISGQNGGAEEITSQKQLNPELLKRQARARSLMASMGEAYIILHMPEEAVKCYQKAIPGMERKDLSVAWGHLQQLSSKLQIPPAIKNIVQESLGSVLVFAGHPYTTYEDHFEVQGRSTFEVNQARKFYSLPARTQIVASRIDQRRTIHSIGGIHSYTRLLMTPLVCEYATTCNMPGTLLLSAL